MLKSSVRWLTQRPHFDWLGISTGLTEPSCGEQVGLGWPCVGTVPQWTFATWGKHNFRDKLERWALTKERNAPAPRQDLSIRMVAGSQEVAERKENLVEEVGFEPTTFGL